MAPEIVFLKKKKKNKAQLPLLLNKTSSFEPDKGGGCTTTLITLDADCGLRLCAEENTAGLCGQGSRPPTAWQGPSSAAPQPRQGAAPQHHGQCHQAPVPPPAGALHSFRTTFPLKAPHSHHLTCIYFAKSWNVRRKTML